MPTNYQEPIEKEDLDVAKKLREVKTNQAEKPVSQEEKPAEAPSVLAPEREFSPEAAAEKEAGMDEKLEGKMTEKIETARKKISVQKAPKTADISADAGAISQFTEYEKKVEKLVELALEKGPLHAIKVAQHMDKGKSSAQMDNYTLDEIHDRLLEEELRNQLIQKGLLKEL